MNEKLLKDLGYIAIGFIFMLINTLVLKKWFYFGYATINTLANVYIFYKIGKFFFDNTTNSKTKY